MYIPEFIFGITSTLSAEVALIVIIAGIYVFKSNKNDKGDKK